MNSFERCIYPFGSGIVEGDGSMKEILGGKGSGLAEMVLLGVPVPPGFTITTDVCKYYLKHGELPRYLETEIANALSWLEDAADRRFNDPENPLLVSVRSGA